jgi:selenocysteine-specific elongation factor
VAPDKLKQLLTVLVNQGRLVKVKEDLYFHREAIDPTESQLVDFLKKNKEIISSSSKTSPKPPGNSPSPG